MTLSIGSLRFFVLLAPTMVAALGHSGSSQLPAGEDWANYHMAGKLQYVFYTGQQIYKN